jgi:hypothetical protein
MGFGWRKSFKILPGIRLNASHAGLGMSFGVKGLRHSVHSSGRRTTTASIPGTGLYYQTTHGSGRSSRSQAYQRKSEIDKQLRDQTRLEELQYNALEVEAFENKLMIISSIHKDCDDSVNWQTISTTPPPFPKGEMGPKEKEAHLALESFRPSLLSRFLNTDDSKLAKLAEQIQLARQEDLDDYDSWEGMVKLSFKVLKGDPVSYFVVIEQFAPLDDLTEFGSGFEFFAEKPYELEVEFDVRLEEVIPKEVVSLTKTGKLSTKEMSKSQYFNLQQEYVCSCMIRIARDLFALLPLNQVVIHAMDERLNTATGYKVSVPLVSVKINRSDFQGLNFDSIDCSDAISSFEHQMKFKKTTGFDPVHRIS